MTKCMNHPLWDLEMPLHKFLHNKPYEKWGTTDKTKHKPNTLQPRIRHTRIMTSPLVLKFMDTQVKIKLQNYRIIKNYLGNCKIIS